MCRKPLLWCKPPFILAKPVLFYPLCGTWAKWLSYFPAVSVTCFLLSARPMSCVLLVLPSPSHISHFDKMSMQSEVNKTFDSVELLLLGCCSFFFICFFFVNIRQVAQYVDCLSKVLGFRSRTKTPRVRVESLPLALTGGIAVVCAAVKTTLVLYKWPLPLLLILYSWSKLATRASLDVLSRVPKAIHGTVFNWHHYGISRGEEFDQGGQIWNRTANLYFITRRWRHL